LCYTAIRTYQIWTNWTRWENEKKRIRQYAKIYKQTSVKLHALIYSSPIGEDYTFHVVERVHNRAYCSVLFRI
jgi:hypothetical protein